MLKYLLLKNDVYRFFDVDVIERSRYNYMLFIYFLEIAFIYDGINWSLLAKMKKPIN